MNTLLAIDPGEDTGWAHFGHEGRLVQCGCIAPERYGLLPPADAVVVETPQVYRHGKADPNRLLVLAQKVGQIVQLYPGAVKVTPHDWKGDLPKDVCHRRFLGKLSPSEVMVMDRCLVGIPAAKRHNVKDAVCLGVWRLGR